MNNSKVEKKNWKNTPVGKFLKAYGGLIIVILGMMVITTILTRSFYAGSKPGKPAH